ncbi:hypothetical protein [Ancylobacter sp. TS-1]|uniref:hypothetical protein n=1 Tax=Ancylobacter sp. TS-1 TaxID=1850374 RepID=UPI0013911504|nr:hypothetical protein [Ancylobacter sp. TS-1]
MTAKRVTIGAKPTLVPRDTAEAGSDMADTAGPAAAPAAATAASIEDWLRQGEARASASDPADGEGEPADATPAGAAPEIADFEIAASEIAAEESRAPEAAAGPRTAPHSPVEPVPAAASATVGSAAATSSRTPPPAWAGIAGGAAAGAAAAAIVAWALMQLVPGGDVRVGPLVERVAHIETGLRDNETRFGKLNNELAQIIDAQDATTTRIDEQASAIDAIKLAATGEASRTDPGAPIASPVFAVALAQLRATFYSGRPFEAELVNVYAIAGNNDLFSGYLTELMAPARTGVPNAAELYRVFPSYVAAAGLRIGDPAGYYQYGMSLVNRYVGLATEPHKVEMSNLGVTRASALLAAGDVAGAMSALRDLDAPSAVAMAPWLEAARSYLRSETAITEMTRITVDRLRERVVKEMPAAGAGELAPQLQGDAPATLAPAPPPEASLTSPDAPPLATPSADVGLPPAPVPDAAPDTPPSTP